MISLLAKDQSDGRYYFTEDEVSVYMIKPPLAKAQKEYVDSFSTFSMKSFEADLCNDSREFQNIEELRQFAIQDSSLKEYESVFRSQQSMDDLLIYAPVEIVEEYFEMIENMIRRNEFNGLDIFFRQLSQNYEILKKRELFDKKNKLKSEFDGARFPHIDGTTLAIANQISNRIRREHKVLLFAS